MTGKQVFYEGRVQGVGFRFTVKQIAKGFEVTGFVKNLPDGRVELQITGDEVETEEFLQEIRDSNLGPHIRNEIVDAISLPAETKGFTIAY